MRATAIVVVFLTLAAPGCSDEAPTLSDGPALPDGSSYPDLGQLPDLPPTTDPCESEWKDAVNAQSKVSSGTVTTTDVGGGVYSTEVDASAGGMNQAHLNPFVYISLADGTRVDIDDLAAKTSTAWDLALRRVVIRVNGGDSGSGQGAVALLAGKTLDQVTAVPPASAFATDDFLDESCTIKRDPINNILTAFGGSSGLWYDYDAQTSKVTPKAQVYVVRLAGGGHVKLAIDSYYGATGQGGHFTLRWSKLP